MAGFDGNVKGKIVDLVSPEINKVARSLQSQIYRVDQKVITVIATGAGTVENISSQCDGSTTVFTTTNTITNLTWVYFNGGMIVEGKEVTKTGNKEITLSFAPPAGSELRLKYV